LARLWPLPLRFTPGRRSLADMKRSGFLPRRARSSTALRGSRPRMLDARRCSSRVIIIRIWVATIGLSYGFRQESRLQSGSPSDLRTLDNEQVGLSSPWIWHNRKPPREKVRRGIRSIVNSIRIRTGRVSSIRSPGLGARTCPGRRALPGSRSSPSTQASARSTSARRGGSNPTTTYPSCECG
jgi:hypothetical protein